MPEWLTILLSFLTSAAGSLILSKLSFKQEVKKLKLQFIRDDSVTLRESYAKMRTYTLIYIANKYPIEAKNAQEQLSLLYTMVSPELKPCLEKIEKNLFSENIQKLSTSLKELDEQWTRVYS